MSRPSTVNSTFSFPWNSQAYLQSFWVSLFPTKPHALNMTLQTAAMSPLIMKYLKKKKNPTNSFKCLWICQIQPALSPFLFIFRILLLFLDNWYSPSSCPASEPKHYSFYLQSLLFLSCYPLLLMAPHIYLQSIATWSLEAFGDNPPTLGYILGTDA